MGQLYQQYDIVYLKTNDWPLPLLTFNPHYEKYFVGNHGLYLFGDLGSKLMALSPELQNRVDEFQKKHFRKLNIGIQIRTKKHFRGLEKAQSITYFRVAKLIQQKYGFADEDTSYFFTTDEPSKLQEAYNYLGKDNVWYTEFHSRRTQVGDLMAVVDMQLLSMCNETVITHASSFGQVAAALGKTYTYLSTKT